MINDCSVVMKREEVRMDIYFLLDKITQYESPVGASLLSQELNVPQATIGRRLKDLENMGYLKKYSNRGRKITEEGMNILKKKKYETSRHEEATELVKIKSNVTRKSLVECIEIRKKLEIMAVELACDKITSKQADELREILNNYAREVSHDTEKKGPMDLLLHLKIAKISDNQTLHNILRIILISDDKYIRFYDLTKKIENGAICLRQHSAIVSAIIERNIEKAIAAMNEHLEKVMTDINNFYSEKPLSE